MLFPGGENEVGKGREGNVELRWKAHADFVRMAGRCNVNPVFKVPSYSSSSTSTTCTMSTTSSTSSSSSFASASYSSSSFLSLET